MRWLRWLRPDLDKRPQEPDPAPALYDWQQDRDVITDLKLWNVFTVQINPNITQAEKPSRPDIDLEPWYTHEGSDFEPARRPQEYGDSVKPWGPGAHVTGWRGGGKGSD